MRSPTWITACTLFVATSLGWGGEDRLVTFVADVRPFSILSSPHSELDISGLMIHVGFKKQF